MNIKTKYMGDMEVDRSQLIYFPSGMPGFLNETEFILFNLPENPAFQIMQSTATESIAFVVANPYHFYIDYTFDLDDNTVESLQIASERDIVVLSIVTLKRPFNKSTLNLKAPVIINPATKRGKQYILTIDEYPTKASIMSSANSHLKGE